MHPFSKLLVEFHKDHYVFLHLPSHRLNLSHNRKNKLIYLHKTNQILVLLYYRVHEFLVHLFQNYMFDEKYKNLGLLYNLKAFEKIKNTLVNQSSDERVCSDEQWKNIFNDLKYKHKTVNQLNLNVYGFRGDLRLIFVLEIH